MHASAKMVSLITFGIRQWNALLIEPRSDVWNNLTALGPTMLGFGRGSVQLVLFDATEPDFMVLGRSGSNV